MRKPETVNAPWLGGLIIGAAAAFGVAVIFGKFDLVPAVAIAAVVGSIAGGVLRMPRAAKKALPFGHKLPVKGARAALPPASVAHEVAQVATFVAAPIAEPAPMLAAVSEAGPERLAAPRTAKGDDLKAIEGIGPALEKLWHSLGFYRFDQNAAWSDADVAVVDAGMKTFKGRIARDKWVAQAKLIGSDGLEAFRVRAQTNNY